MAQLQAGGSFKTPVEATCRKNIHCHKPDKHCGRCLVRPKAAAGHAPPPTKRMRVPSVAMKTRKLEQSADSCVSSTTSVSTCSASTCGSLGPGNLSTPKQDTCPCAKSWSCILPNGHTGRCNRSLKQTTDNYAKQKKTTSHQRNGGGRRLFA